MANAVGSRRLPVIPTDWRVQVATVVVDGLIVFGVLLLLGLKAVDTTVAVALLGPLIGARAAVHKANAQQQPNPASVVGNAGGALALLFAVGSIWRLIAVTRGHVVAVLAFALAALGIYSACAQPLPMHHLFTLPIGTQ